MALQTREQHIKRDKATSNICTAQVLLAVMAGMYAVFHGPKGLKFIADKVHATAVTTANALNNLGIYQTNSYFFDTILVKADAQKVKTVAEKHQVNFFYPDAESISISLNETTSIKDINQIISIFEEVTGKTTEKINELTNETMISENFIRKSEFLKHEVFNNHHSESQLMRYIKKLERKDLALNHSMISLGSCTMKLNAAAEMLPLSMANWNNIHPFAPLEQVEGYQTMLKKLEHQLNIVTGFAGTTLQPNSGAQGEYAGLMAIRAYHLSRGDHHRNVCLIPSSAHGTNPASAAMAGMQIIVTKTMENGNIDVDDLREKAILHKDNLSCLMVTYPSTHGVFESAICEITQLIHDNGGLVYMDGANMNAQVGLTNPGNIGADVCHLNLHKTFAIPHGGGLPVHRGDRRHHAHPVGGDPGHHPLGGATQHPALHREALAAQVGGCIGHQPLERGNHLQGAHDGVEGVLARRLRAEAVAQCGAERRGHADTCRACRRPCDGLEAAGRAIGLPALAPPRAREPEGPCVGRARVGLGDYRGARLGQLQERAVHGPQAHVRPRGGGFQNLAPRGEGGAAHLLRAHQPEQRGRSRHGARHGVIAAPEQLRGVGQAECLHQLHAIGATGGAGVEGPLRGDVAGRRCGLVEHGPSAVGHALEDLAERAHPHGPGPIQRYANGNIEPGHHRRIAGVQQHAHVPQWVPGLGRPQLPAVAVVVCAGHPPCPRSHAPVRMQDDAAQSSGGNSMTSLKWTTVTSSCSVISRE
jgi:glycine cleavage system protein P-like pyridoxal-binding family